MEVFCARSMFVEPINADLYKIPLPEGAVYPFLIWKTDMPSDRFSEKWEVVIVPLKKFISLCFDSPIKMIESAEFWSIAKREKYIKGHEPDDCPLCMPRIGLSLRTLKQSLYKDDVFLNKNSLYWTIGFANGRHRTRIAEFLGAEFIPVQIEKSNVSNFKKILGIED